MEYSIYKINFPNGKVYIGQTKNSVEERYTEHCWDRTNSKNVLHRPIIFAMKKYKGQTSVEMLEEKLSLEEADFLEKYYIKHFNSTDRNFGYNLSPGGNSGSIMSEEGKKRHKEKMQKHYDNPEYLEKITKHLKTETHKQKMNEGFQKFLQQNPDHYKKINSGRTRSVEGNRKAALAMGGKPFMCVETGEVFYTLKEAADHFGSPCKDSIYKVLKGKRKTYKKLHFKYVE